jgi:hypothetical protein
MYFQAVFSKNKKISLLTTAIIIIIIISLSLLPLDDGYTLRLLLFIIEPVFAQLSEASILP